MLDTSCFAVLAPLAQITGHSIFIANVVNGVALAPLDALAKNIGPQKEGFMIKTGVAGGNHWLQDI